MPSSYIGADPICISGLTGGSQQPTVLETEVSLTGNEWQKHPIVTGPEALCILGNLRRGYFKDPKGDWWAFGIAALETEEIRQLSTLPGLSEDLSVVGLLRVEEQLVLIVTTVVHRWQYRTNRDSLIPIHKVICRLESQGVITECGPQFAFTWRGVQYTWNRLPQGWKNSPTICRGLIQTALEQGEAPEHLQYTDDIIVWSNIGEAVFEKEKKVVQILLKAGFAVKQSKVKGPAQEIQFLGIKWQDGRRQIPMDVINKITAMSPPTSKKETPAFLGQWKQNNWQHRRKPIWAAALWQDIAAWVENLVVKVHHADAHVPKSQATEEHQNNQQVDQAAQIEVAQVDLDWQDKGELFIAWWAHDTSGHEGRGATYRWACDRGVDLTMDTIAQVIHECETCTAIKQAKLLKPVWYGGRWLKYKYGEAWQIDYITLPQTHQGKHHVLTMVEATTGWLETYPVPHATARNAIRGLEKQVLWRHGTPERIESDNGTHFRNNLIDTWAKEHGIEWVYHIPYHAPAFGKIEQYNGLLKTTLRAMGDGMFKHWDTHLAKATWLVNTRGSANRAGPAQSKLLRTVEGDKVPVVHIKNMLGKTIWVTPA
ncbi:hypothetical protein QYF61_025171 [Mycteria americana]|uniref:ribonuclease H n=1 Tax=Mycteria americana TaxID=33587 RepID=A0AAN7NVN9_MYCAM|nr:hypothetical protein QYF61_025171 [Mycteria americana]